MVYVHYSQKQQLLLQKAWQQGLRLRHPLAQKRLTRRESELQKFVSFYNTRMMDTAKPNITLNTESTFESKKKFLEILPSRRIRTTIASLQ